MNEVFIQILAKQVGLYGIKDLNTAQKLEQLLQIKGKQLVYSGLYN